jgi:predicted NBD/HSP70 family sugar kinase
MSERLFALTDVGGSKLCTAVWDDEMRPLGMETTATNPADYYGTVDAIAETAQRIADGRGEIVAISAVVAGELDDHGRLVRAGELTPWLGVCLGVDLAGAMNIPQERGGVNNDTKAAALSQQHINGQNGNTNIGFATTLSTGWGGAIYLPHGEGGVIPDEPGHRFLRKGAICPCGQPGHAEAHISGAGVLRNHGISMEGWLRDRDNAGQFVVDVSESVMSLVERHGDMGIKLQEIRWMGGVASNQQVLMRAAYDRTRHEFGSNAPGWDAMTMGSMAGLHGAYLDARQRAAEA